MLVRHEAELAPILIRADYDDEARVWVAQSDEIPLVTEAATVEVLCQKFPALIQDVLEENGDPRAGTDVPFELLIQSHSAPRAELAWMADFAPEVKKILRENGCTFHKIMSRRTANGIMKQAGLPKMFK